MNAIKNLLHSNGIIIICSLIIGYCLWMMLSHNQIIQETINIPVFIYKDKDTIESQSSIDVIIEGARHQLKSLYYHPPQVSIYRDDLPDNKITISHNDILLPETLSIIKFWPQEIEV